MKLKLSDLWTKKAPSVEPTTTKAPATPLEDKGALVDATVESQASAATTPSDKDMEVAKLRALGLDPTKKEGPAGLGRSRILDVLGPDRFASVPAVKVDGKVAWFNFALAEELGFSLGSKTMTPEVERQILDALAYRALGPGESAGGREVVELKADRYGGTGIGNNEGAGRAAFLPWGNLNIKGVGRTPLAKIKETEDFHHAHGGAPMREGLIEAVWGEVGSNLFSRGSSRILAIIDVGDFTQWQDGSKERRALIIRASHQLRPAHVLAGYEQGGQFSERVLVSMARELGALVEKETPAGRVPDLRATMEKLIAQHAKAAAEQMRFRVIHGALTTGNMQLDGAQLDLATMSTQPRTASIKTLGHGSPFGKEHEWRSEELQRMYTAVQMSVGWDRERAPPIGISDAMYAAYKSELELQMLDAVGLKPSMAKALQADEPRMCMLLQHAIQGLAGFGNGGDLSADKKIVEDSIVDVYNALRFYPAFLFDGDTTREQRKAKMMELLRPNVLGSEERKAERLTMIGKYADKLVDALDDVYAAATARAASQDGAHYDSVEGMKRSIAARTAFENEPIDGLYKASAHEMFDRVVDEFGRTGDPKLFTDAIDKLAASSVRSFEALLTQGKARRIDGGIEIERRTVDGIDYAVRALSDGKRKLHLEIPLTGSEAEGFSLSTLPGSPRLSRADVEALRYRFTTDGWKSDQEVQAVLGADDKGAPVLTFDIPVLKGSAARLEGLFHVEAAGGFWIKDGTTNFRGYTFAVPDQREADEIQRTL